MREGNTILNTTIYDKAQRKPIEELFLSMMRSRMTPSALCQPVFLVEGQVIFESDDK